MNQYCSSFYLHILSSRKKRRLSTRTEHKALWKGERVCSSQCGRLLELCTRHSTVWAAWQLNKACLLSDFSRRAPCLETLLREATGGRYFCDTGSGHKWRLVGLWHSTTRSGAGSTIETGSSRGSPHSLCSMSWQLLQGVQFLPSLNHKLSSWPYSRCLLIQGQAHPIQKAVLGQTPPSHRSPPQSITSCPLKLGFGSASIQLSSRGLKFNYSDHSETGTRQGGKALIWRLTFLSGITVHQILAEKTINTSASVSWS